jgi:purine-nucleoside phosphorylase
MALLPAIVNPVRGKKPPDVGPVVLMAATQEDLLLICALHAGWQRTDRPLFMSHLTCFSRDGQRLCVVGPVIGAPYAALILESLIVWGARKIFFLGWCGTIDPKVAIADIVVPTGALIDEGTSPNYTDQPLQPVLPSFDLLTTLSTHLKQAAMAFHPGLVWSTDAIFRETAQKVIHYRKLNALAVEMEVSALFSVAAFRKVEAAALLVVSDSLATLTWQPGFKTEAFKNARTQACEAMVQLSRKVSACKP